MRRLDFRTLRHKASSYVMTLMSLLAVFITVALPIVNADPLPAKEITALDSYPNWVGNCGTGITPTDNDSSDATNNKVYVIGDSLTVGMRDSGGLKSKLTTADWDVTDIEATGGINIDNSIPKVTADNKQSVSSAGTVIVGLGTNKSSDPAKKIDQMIDAIQAQKDPKNNSDSANLKQIIWINAYSTKASYTSFNNLLDAREKSGKIDKVLDWAKEAKANPGDYSLSSDSLGIHTSPSGYTKRSSWLVKDLGDPPSTTDTKGNTDTTDTQVSGDTTDASDKSSLPTIVIDPGHSGNDIKDSDPDTGLFDHDYPNTPELTEVFSVSQQVQKQLQSDGYKVVMTKNSASDSVSFRKRANIANKANADLAISIHNNHDTSWDNMGGGDGGQVYAQNVGDYRQNKPGMGSGQKKIAFSDDAIAKKSNTYGKIFAEQRSKAENHKVSVTHVNFDSRPDLPSGNLAMVQLFAKVPWVYNEVGAPQGPLSHDELDKYAKGLIAGVEKSVPSSGAKTTANAATCCPVTGAGGDPSAGGTTSLTGKDNRQKVFNFFIGKGLKDFQAAGIVGNLQQESGVNPKSPGGYLAQWQGGRATALETLAKKQGKPVTDLAVQLDYLWLELTGGPGASGDYSHVLKQVKATSNYTDATIQFMGTKSVGGDIDGFENPGIPAQENRIKYAKAALDDFGGGSSGGGTTTDSSGACSGAGTGSADCQNAVGTAKIICEAKKYDPVSYEESAAGNHLAGGNEAWLKTCPTIGPSCKLDCSGLVNIAVYDAFGYDLKQNTTAEAADKKNWKHISFNELQPGDLIQPNSGHVEIVDNVKGNTINTFGAHSADRPQPAQVSPTSFPNSSGNLYLHWIGKGSS